jgi:uncharacterized MnhB-related membrane protein
VSRIILAVLLLLVAVSATAVVLTRDTTRQAVLFAGYGVLLGVLMVVLDAPDVAMSQLAVGGAVVPLLVVLAIAACRREVRRHRDEQGERS